MKFAWHGKQQLAEQIKTPPERDDSKHETKRVDDSGEMIALRKRWSRKRCKTLSAKQTIIMLADAFPAEKTPAVGTSRRRLA